MLDAIAHIALVVKDPARTAVLFEQLFSSRVVERLDEEGHAETFVQLGRTWFVLAKADIERPRSGDHIAFAVKKSDLPAYAEKLSRLGVEFFLAREDTSLYFFDYDNHVFELDSTDFESGLTHAV